MKWIEKRSSFRYNGTPVTRIKATCVTPVITYTVYEAVGGKVMMYHSKMINWRDPDNEISPQPAVPCGTVAAGKLLCEQHYKSIVDRVNAAWQE